MPRRIEPASALGLALAVFAVSWAAILVRSCDAPALGIAFYRMLLSTAALLPWGFLARRRVSLRTAGLTLVAGFLLALHFATWISSLEYTSVASSVVLVSTQPAFTAVIGPFFLRELPGRLGWIAMLLCLGGIVVLAGGDLDAGPRAILGDGLALAGALTASLYLMIGRRLRDRIDFAPYLLAVNGTAAVVLLVFALFAGTPLSGYPGRTWLWLVLLAAVPNLLGHGLLNWSVRRLRAFTVNLSILGEPVLATIYAAALFGEFPVRAFYPGTALIVVGIILAIREEAGLRKLPVPPEGPVP